MEFELRAILLVVGILILVIVGFDFYRRKPKYSIDVAAKEPRLDSKTVEPNLDFADMAPFVAVTSTIVSSMPEVVEEIYPALDIEPTPVVPYVAPQIMAITIQAREADGFAAGELAKALHAAQMLFGKGNVFYRYTDDLDANEVLFRAVKAVEPGYFAQETLINEYLPGITLVLLPEKVADFSMAFDKFVRAAKQIAFAVNGELLDDRRQPLTLTTLAKYRQQGQRA